MEAHCFSNVASNKTTPINKTRAVINIGVIPEWLVRIFFPRHPRKSQEEMTAILLWSSSPRVWRPAGFGDLSFRKRTTTTNNRFPTTTLGNDNNNNAGQQNLGNDKEKTISTSWVVAVKDNSPKDKQKTRRVQAAGVTKNNYIKYPTAKLIRLAAGSIQVKRLANSNTLGLVARAGE